MSQSGDVFTNRHARLQAAIQESSLDAIVLNPGPSMVYFSGLHFHISERPVLLAVTSGEKPRIVVPELESGKLASTALDLDSETYTENLTTWEAAFKRAFSGLGRNARIGVEPRSMRVLELNMLRAALPDASVESADSVVASLRIRKDEKELALMSKAVQIAENALEQTLTEVRPGVSEREMNNLLVENLLRNGSSGELPFQPIVAFGANSANPHAVSSDYKAAPGDLLLFDWGANYEGYFSDLTRTFCLGEPDDELRHIHDTVRKANEAGRSAAGPGVAAGDVDRATRKVIEDAGYGELFVHRTGHGLGLEVHEDPYIRGDNTERLETGMTFTVEPGIYMNGRGGVRVEDDVVITENGARSLSTFPRELKVIPV